MLSQKLHFARIFCIYTCVLHVFVEYLKAAKRNLDCTTPGLVTSPTVAEKHLIEVKSLSISPQVPRADSVSRSKLNSLQRFQARIVSLFRLLF